MVWHLYNVVSMRVFLLILFGISVFISTIPRAYASCSCEPGSELGAFCASTSLPEVNDAGVSSEGQACCEVCGGANGAPTCDECEVHECKILLENEPMEPEESTEDEAGEGNTGCSAGGGTSGGSILLLLLLIGLSAPHLRQKCR